MPSRISVIVVAWNAREFLRKCLASVDRETRRHPYETVVVDNGSTDHSAEMVKAEFPSAALLRNDRNEGFVKGNNRALRRILAEARSDYVLLLNSDAVVNDGAVDRLADFLDAHPEAGGAGPALILPSGAFQTGPGGWLPSLRSAFDYFFFVYKLLPRSSRPLFIDPNAERNTGTHHLIVLKSGQLSDVSPYFSPDFHRRVDWLSGACLMLRRSAVERAGLMNEEYFLYADDIDWCGRMTRQGIALYFLPGVRVVHFHGLTAKTIHKKTNTRWLKFLFRYVRLNRGLFEALFFRLIAAAGFGLRAFIHSLRSPFSQKTGEMAAYAIYSLFGR